MAKRSKRNPGPHHRLDIGFPLHHREHAISIRNILRPIPLAGVEADYVSLILADAESDARHGPVGDGQRQQFMYRSSLALQVYGFPSVWIWK